MTHQVTPPADDPDVVYFMVSPPDTRRRGYTWRIWAGGSSFYVAPMGAAFGGIKFSLHGPDEKHPTTSMFKFDTPVPPGKGTPGVDGVILLRSGPTHRIVVPGRVITATVKHVVRIRTTWDLFNRRVPPVAYAKTPERGQLGLHAPTPRPMRAADLDIFVCDRRPFWPDEPRARRSNAAVPAIVNGANPPQYLTAVSYERSVITDPEPKPFDVPRPLSDADQLRAFVITEAPEGFLWITEYLTSRAS